MAGSGTEGSLQIPLAFGYEGTYSATVNGVAEGLPYADAVEDGGDSLIFFEVPAGTSFSRFALFDADVGAGDGSDDLDLQVLGPDVAGWPLVGSSGTPTSAEQVDMANPQPGLYAVFVIDYASAPGPTPFTLFNFNLQGDASNTELDAPAAATVGGTGMLHMEWMGLNPGTRALGIIQHQNESGVIATTEVSINTR